MPPQKQILIRMSTRMNLYTCLPSLSVQNAKYVSEANEVVAAESQVIE